MKESENIIISDFDGSMTRYDFYSVISSCYSIDDKYWQLYLDNKITHFEAMANIYKLAKTSEEDLKKVIDQMQFDEALPEVITKLNNNSWRVIIASAGAQWYIQYLLNKYNLNNIEIHANPGVFIPNQGLIIHKPVDSLYFSDTDGIDKNSIVKHALKNAKKVAYVGDGRPDLAAILLINPEYRFARGWLAEELKNRHESFNNFINWQDIANKLIIN